MRRLVLAAAVAAFAATAAPLLPWSPGPAYAQQKPASISDFMGPWVGRSQPGSDRERAATVLIETAPDNGFKVTWANFESDPAGSGEVTERERTLVFRPSKVNGIWLSEPSKDPFDTLAAWARVEDRSLIVSTAALRSDGRLERQSYRRTLTKDGLALEYRRWLDQDLDRQIDAEFLRLLSNPAKRG